MGLFRGEGRKGRISRGIEWVMVSRYWSDALSTDGDVGVGLSLKITIVGATWIQ